MKLQYYQNNILNREDIRIINQIGEDRNLSKRTLYGYKDSLTLYVQHTKMHLKELIQEADNEEDNKVRWKYSKVKNKLVSFQNYLIQNYAYGTVKAHFTRVKTFYQHNEITIQYIPSINTRKVNINEPILFTDLLTSEELTNIINNSDKLMKAIILFCTSSGCGRQEMMNLTIADFIKATSEYHNNKNNTKTILKDLNSMDNIIPVFKIRRQKTNKYYYTFCTPQASKSIIDYLMNTKRRLYKKDKLFKINHTKLQENYNDLNNLLGLGKAGGYNRLRSHMLRKYHASTLKNDGMSMDEIDTLQGRNKDDTRQAYFKDNPLTLKEEYIKHIPALTINGIK